MTEAARFRSREPAPPAPVPPKRAPHYHKTGRTAQLNVRVMPASLEKVYAIAARQGWLIGETVERALKALERELKGEAMDDNAIFRLVEALSATPRQQQPCAADDCSGTSVAEAAGQAIRRRPATTMRFSGRAPTAASKAYGIELPK